MFIGARAEDEGAMRVAPAIEVSVDCEGITLICGGTTEVCVVCGDTDWTVVMSAAPTRVDTIGVALAIGVDDVADWTDGGTCTTEIVSDELVPELLEAGVLVATELGDTMPTIGSVINAYLYYMTQCHVYCILSPPGTNT